MTWFALTQVSGPLQLLLGFSHFPGMPRQQSQILASLSLLLSVKSKVNWLKKGGKLHQHKDNLKTEINIKHFKIPCSKVEPWNRKSASVQKHEPNSSRGDGILNSAA